MESPEKSNEEIARTCFDGEVFIKKEYERILKALNQKDESAAHYEMENHSLRKQVERLQDCTSLSCIYEERCKTLEKESEALKKTIQHGTEQLVQVTQERDRLRENSDARDEAIITEARKESSEEITALKKRVEELELLSLNYSEDAKKIQKEYLELEKEILSYDAKMLTKNQELEALRKKTEVTMGVGEGSGRMFVYGDYESIKHLQEKIFKLEKLQAEAGKLRELLRRIKITVINGEDDIEIPWDDICKLCDEALAQPSAQDIKFSFGNSKVPDDVTLEKSKSACCSSPVIVESSDEGTSFWVCEKCQRACDVA